ncbi:dITP/XTP pyrophosphatase [Entomoplasma ellychniae]|uniref:dITP/XTP pyrophosphatase n=2 Tax=Entomoplasmataceae TaxID=33925 RepID=A0A2S5RGN8_9MOLU|nr:MULTISPECIES: non-canonical purine NTP pyrophosphatase [Entomoplasmataceae]PPE04512.1 dITP/XTP pyrophosphatase [Entomoplasma ellychniae]PPE06285.1 dITP/XTP pyrophosphatase [Mesoplasma corruscae]
MNKKTLWFASSNKGKIKDIKSLLGLFDIKFLDELPDYVEPEENGDTFEANAIIKAKSLSEVVDGWVISDDSGFCVDALNGFPGVLSKRWAYPVSDDEKLCELLLAKIKKETNMSNLKANFTTCLVLYNHTLNKQYIFTGLCEGQLGDKIIKGNDTFAYDWIFKPDQFNVYFAELSSELKRKISARGIAVKKLIDFIESKEFEYEY